MIRYNLVRDIEEGMPTNGRDRRVDDWTGPAHAQLQEYTAFSMGEKLTWEAFLQIPALRDHQALLTSHLAFHSQQAGTHRRT
jgi:hypothetical protein